MVKVAVVGLGTISATHLQAIENSHYGELICTCDTDTSKKMLSPVPFYTDMLEMVSKEEFDCVHICLPHYLHAEAIKLFAKHKKHIFTEKPVALSYSEGKTLLKYEEDVKIGVCLQNRYNKTAKVLKEIIQTQRYGKFLGIKGVVTWCRKQNYYDAGPWRGVLQQSGGGVMINQSIHTLDLMQYIVGDFKTIRGNIMNYSLDDIEVEDTASAFFEYENGGTGIFFATNAYCANSSVEIEVVCEEAIIRMQDHKCDAIKKDNSIERICEDEIREGEKTYYGSSHYLAIEAFHRAIAENTSDYITLEEGLKSLKTIQEIMVYSKEG
ncbi:MAG: Gfo/Idh/MocA family oxidoreductase [Eubacteriales bacterium]